MLRKCIGCGLVKYCNEVCQSIDWERGHRNSKGYQSDLKQQVTNRINVLLYDGTFGGKYSVYGHINFGTTC